jgi:hypothetical protein
MLAGRDRSPGRSDARIRNLVLDRSVLAPGEKVSRPHFGGAGLPLSCCVTPLTSWEHCQSLP